MARYITRLTYSDHDVSDGGAEHESLTAASKAAIRAAADIARDQAASGEHLAHVEVMISEGENVVARHVVTLSVADVDDNQGA